MKLVLFEALLRVLDIGRGICTFFYTYVSVYAYMHLSIMYIRILYVCTYMCVYALSCL
jgi:hypothetical protein